MFDDARCRFCGVRWFPRLGFPHLQKCPLWWGDGSAPGTGWIAQREAVRKSAAKRAPSGKPPSKAPS